MRVLGLATSYPKSPSDGTAPFIRAICRGLCQNSMAVDLLLPAHPELTWSDGDPPVSLHTFAYTLPGSKALHVWGYGRGLRNDRKLRVRTLAAVPTAAASCFYNLDRLATRLRPNIIHAHWLLPNGPLAALVASRRALPLVVSLHGSGVTMAEKSSVGRFAARRTLSVASHVTACSSDLAERAIKLGADPESISVVPYGVDVASILPGTLADRRALRVSLEIPDVSIVILAIGRLVAKKGFAHLIDAVARGPRDLYLVVAGAGDLRQMLEAYAGTRGIQDRARFLGAIDRSRVAELLRGADVLAVPSVRDDTGNVDGLPNVLLEGFAAGLPVVASRVGGIPDVVVHGENGLLVPPGDTDELANALENLACNEALRASLGCAARQFAASRLAWPHIASCFSEILASAAFASSNLP